MNYGDDCEGLEAVDLDEVDIRAELDAVSAAECVAAGRAMVTADDYGSLCSAVAVCLADQSEWARFNLTRAVYRQDRHDIDDYGAVVDDLDAMADLVRNGDPLRAGRRIYAEWVGILLGHATEPEYVERLLDEHPDAVAPPAVHVLMLARAEAVRRSAVARTAEAVDEGRRHPPMPPAPAEVERSHRRHKRPERCQRPPGMDRPATSPRQATAPPASTSREVGYPALFCCA